MYPEFFAGCYDEAAIKSRFRDLAKEHHPDKGGDLATMQAVNAQYTARLRGEYRKTKSDDEAEQAVEADERAAAIVAQIIHLPEITVEIVGRWLWVTGQTFHVRTELKAAGLKWAGKKRAWYWHAPEDKCRGGKKDLDQIRATYGSQVIQGRAPRRLAA